MNIDTCSNTNEHVSPAKSDWWTKQKGKRKHSDSEGSDSSYIDSGDDAENYLKASPVKGDKLEALSPDKIVSRDFSMTVFSVIVTKDMKVLLNRKGPKLLL